MASPSRNEVDRSSRPRLDVRRSARAYVRTQARGDFCMYVRLGALGLGGLASCG